MKQKELKVLIINCILRYHYRQQRSYNHPLKNYNPNKKLFITQLIKKTSKSEIISADNFGLQKIKFK